MASFIWQVDSHEDGDCEDDHCREYGMDQGLRVRLKLEAYSISKATTGNGVIVTGKSNDAVIVVIEVDSEGDLAF